MNATNQLNQSNTPLDEVSNKVSNENLTGFDGNQPGHPSEDTVFPETGSIAVSIPDELLPAQDIASTYGLGMDSVLVSGYIPPVFDDFEDMPDALVIATATASGARIGSDPAGKPGAILPPATQTASESRLATVGAANPVPESLESSPEDTPTATNAATARTVAGGRRRDRLEARYAGYKEALSEENWTKLLGIAREEERAAFLELALTMPVAKHTAGEDSRPADPQTRLLQEALAGLDKPAAGKLAGASGSGSGGHEEPAGKNKPVLAYGNKQYETLIWQISLLNEQLADYFDALENTKASPGSIPAHMAAAGIAAQHNHPDTARSELAGSELEPGLRAVLTTLSNLPVEITAQAGAMGSLLVETINAEVSRHVSAQVAELSASALSGIGAQIDKQTGRIERYWKASTPAALTRRQLSRGLWVVGVLLTLTIGLAAASAYLYADRLSLSVDARKYAYVRYRALSGGISPALPRSKTRRKQKSGAVPPQSGTAFTTVWQETETLSSQASAKQ